MEISSKHDSVLTLRFAQAGVFIQTSFLVLIVVTHGKQAKGGMNTTTMGRMDATKQRGFMGKTKIEWADFTFNPWWGCVKVSDGCKHCYAETFAKRTGNKVWGVNAERRFFGDKHWDQPYKWNTGAQKNGERARVFCASMADVFEDRPDLHAPRFRLGKLIMDTPWLDWLVLTKRPENIVRLMAEDHWTPTYGGNDYLPNVWLGTSVENQGQADKRIPELLGVPAAVRFLSCEPLLGPIDFDDRPIDDTANDEFGGWSMLELGIHWVIAGGESGPGSRPMHFEWLVSIKRQCEASGVPFLFKQWGDWIGVDHEAFGKLSGSVHGVRSDGTFWNEFPDDENADSLTMKRVGKKAAGRKLFGQTWDGYPAPEATPCPA